MSILLNAVYLTLIAMAAPWLLYGAWRHGKYREGFAAKWLGNVPLRNSRRPCVWFHAVSVGEVNLLHSLLDRWQQTYPDWECVISSTTKTGYELARKKYAHCVIFYCPLDFSWSVRRALGRLRPNLLVLAELELWPNLVLGAQRHGCQVAVVNGRLSEKSFRGYRRIRPLIALVLRHIDLIATQNEEYAHRFRQLGAEPTRVQVTGSVKFDGAQMDRDQPVTRRLGQFAGFSAADVVFLAGSTQAPEESLAVESFVHLQPNYPHLRLVIVPRHTTRCDEIAALLDRHRVSWQRRSDLDRLGADSRARILLVDTIGELAAWWGTARIAFVGGSLGNRGGQNMIEPAAYGAAVSFGPNTRNFRDTVEMLLAHDSAVVVRNGGELTQFVRRCLDEPGWATELGHRAQHLVRSQQGAADRTISLLQGLVAPSAAGQRNAA